MIISSLKRRAYQHIRGKLVSGELRAGMALSPVALAREIQISHTPVREAISLLESQGLVETLPRIGPVVRRIDRNEFVEMLDLREVVETGAARLAAINASRRELESISQLCRDYLELARESRSRNLTHYGGELFERTDELDAAFHNQILVAAKNRRLYRIAEDLQLVSRVFEHGYDDDIPGMNLLTRLSRVYRGHSRIARALRQRDPDAAENFMRQHLMLAKQAHLSLFDWRCKQRITFE